MSIRAVLLVMLLSFVLGTGGGLYYSWLVDPVKYTNTGPNTLMSSQREDYLQLVAGSYAEDHDLARARLRLMSAGSADGRELGPLADRALRENWDVPRLCALVALAQALNVPVQGLSLCPGVVTPTPEAPAASTLTPTPSATPTRASTATATATRRPSATPSPLPSLTPSPTPRFSYRVVARQQVCSAGGSAALIAVYVQDAQGNGMAGVEARVTWSGGEDRFFTGLKPEVDPGYADFSMAPGVTYALDLPGASGAPLSPQVGDLSAFTCPDPAAAPGVWRVIFERIASP